MKLACRTRSSPQWWSGRATTEYIVLDLRPPIWSFGESSMIAHGIPSQTFPCVLKCAPVTYSSITNRLAAIWRRGLFDPRFGGIRRTWGFGDKIIRYRVHGFLLVPVDTYDLSFTAFELFSWLQKHFFHLGYDNNYHCRSYWFVDHKMAGIWCPILLQVTNRSFFFFINRSFF